MRSDINVSHDYGTTHYPMNILTGIVTILLSFLIMCEIKSREITCCLTLVVLGGFDKILLIIMMIVMDSVAQSALHTLLLLFKSVHHGYDVQAEYPWA